MVPRLRLGSPARRYMRGLTARRGLTTGYGSVHAFGRYQIRQEADVFDTSGTEVVYHVFHDFVLRPRVGFDVNDILVLFRRLVEKILHLLGKLIGGGTERRVPRAQIDISIARHVYDHGIFRVGLLHLPGVLPFVEVDVQRLAEHRRDYHENNQQHEHHVHHGCDVDVGYRRRRLLLFHINSSKGAGGGWPALPATCRRSLLQLARTSLPVYSRPRLAAFEEVIDQLRTGVAHLHVKGVDAVGEVVEHPDGRNSDEQTDSGCNQRFRNTLGNSADAGGLVGRNSRERVDDADNGSEQADEGRCGTDGGQGADAALQLGMHDGFGAIEGALGGLDLLTRNFRTQLMSAKLLQTGDDNFGQMALVVDIGDFDGLVQLAIAKSARDGGGELARLLASGAVRQEAVDHHTYRPGRHQEQ